jgi:uncharacterized membrane protein
VNFSRLSRDLGLQRKLLHAALYEVLAIALVTGALAATGHASTGTGLGLSAAMSVMAMAWNMAFNTLFEAWERRQPSQHRTWQRRCLHALGFEGGLMLLTVPIIMWVLGLSLWAAAAMDASLMVFFLFYTYAFNWAFDRVFGLPAP